MANATKSFNILMTSLSILYNYFDNLIKLLSNLYPTKFPDIFVLSAYEIFYNAKLDSLQGRVIFLFFNFNFFFPRKSGCIRNLCMKRHDYA